VGQSLEPIIVVFFILNTYQSGFKNVKSFVWLTYKPTT